MFLLLVACASARPKPVEAVEGRMPQLVGRWIFSPGDSTLSHDSKAAEGEEAIESPIGATLSLGEGGVMTARAGEFVRRGTWKIVNGMLRMIIDPPPERRELSMTPLVEVDRLTLTGSDGAILVYQRDPFVAIPGAAMPAATVPAAAATPHAK